MRDSNLEGLILVPTKAGPVLKNCPANVLTILKSEPDLLGTIRLNLVTQEIEVWGGPLGGPTPRPLVDSDVAQFSKWLAQEYDLHQSDTVIWARIVAVAESNSYDPIRDYLEMLRWDGVRRLNSMLVDYFSAQSDEESPDAAHSRAEYIQKVSRRIMVSGAARGLNPGCQADSVLILEGVQGAGKTSAARVLGGEWSTSEPIDFKSKDSLALISRVWIAELGELDALRKNEVTAQKNFLSKTHDDFRPSYGRVTKRYPRRVVFIGTTNTGDYLQDETGNRRYWPVAVGKIDIGALARDRDQLWAEAVDIYKAGFTCKECLGRQSGRCVAHRWWFEGDEVQLVTTETDARMAADAIGETIERWILAREPKNRPECVLTSEIITQVLKEPAARGLEIRVGKALRGLGFKRRRITEAGDPSRGKRRAWGYHTPKNLLEAESGTVKLTAATAAATELGTPAGKGAQVCN